MKTKKYILGIILAALILGGCGTTVGDSLGDPPVESPKEVTGYPVSTLLSHEENTAKSIVKIIGNANCVEPLALVVVSELNGQELGRAQADAGGSFIVKVADTAENRIVVRAQGLDKALSYPTYYSIKWPF
ncbi:MAG: hypothetical protein LBL50_02495 [Candidatus Margulisbacteria bacterium]|jgi:hypothetical protein|nr:hypothetical protein [Candidatus Margulisiibacteriota bacterium]